MGSGYGALFIKVTENPNQELVEAWSRSWSSWSWSWRTRRTPTWTGEPWMWSPRILPHLQNFEKLKLKYIGHVSRLCILYAKLLRCWTNVTKSWLRSIKFQDLSPNLISIQFTSSHIETFQIFFLPGLCQVLDLLIAIVQF